jgi:hypothetical protein
VGLIVVAVLGSSRVRLGVEIGLALLAIACLTYLLCRAMAWVTFGFLGLPAGADARPEPRGIGGWLWLPILTIVANIVLAIGQIPKLIAIVESTLHNPTPGGMFLAGAAGLSYVVTAAWLYELYLMWRRRARARRLYVAISLASLALAAAFHLVWIGYFRMPAEGLLQSAAEELSHAVWIPYMLASRRVRNTFVNRRRS